MQQKQHQQQHTHHHQYTFLIVAANVTGLRFCKDLSMYEYNAKAAVK